MAGAQGTDTRRPARYVTQRLTPAALAVAALGVGGLALAGWGGARRLSTLVPRGPRRAGRAPADRDLAWSSPAVLAGTPPRHFYSGRDPKPRRAATIEDLRAMAHRRLPKSCSNISMAAPRDVGVPRAQSRSARRMALSAPLADRRVAPRHLDRAVRPPAWRCRWTTALMFLSGTMWAHADLRLAQAAAEAGIPFAQSTMLNE